MALNTIADPPHDYLDPSWADGGRVHNWHNYTTSEVQGMWQAFTPEQRAALARQADEIAGNEEWD